MMAAVAVSQSDHVALRSELSSLSTKSETYLQASTSIAGAMTEKLGGVVSRTIVAGIWVAFFQECQR